MYRKLRKKLEDLPGMRRSSDVSFRSHTGRDVTDHAETSSRRRGWHVNEWTYFSRFCDVSLVRSSN